MAALSSANEHSLGEHESAQPGSGCPAPPPSVEGGPSTVVTFAVAAPEGRSDALQLCRVDASGSLSGPVARLVPGEPPHVELTNISCTFVLLTVGAELVAAAVCWYRPTCQLTAGPGGSARCDRG